MSEEKDYVCRKCSLFLDSEELNDGKCPQCDDDDCVFLNDLKEDDHGKEI